MTKKEAIKELRETHGMMRAYNIDSSESILMTALNTAIEALEQEPCEDAISREDAIGALEYQLEITSDNGFEKYKPEIKQILNTIYDVQKKQIQALPSVTPIRPKGEWETGYTYPDGEYWKCSVCKELIRVRIPMHFCPNCSADLRGEKDAT